MTDSTVRDVPATELVSACRTSVGDRLRSITYFTPEDHAQVYLRDDLEQDADLSAFVAAEQSGFSSRTAYSESELGDYAFTIRAFDHGYVTRVIEGEEGVFVTTDPMTMARFRDVAAAVSDVLG
ncbi:MAG: hypothetical protein ABEJ68_09175 [Halobacteriaceae archaeon]